MSEMKQKVAVKAVIVNAEGKVLLLQKGDDNERHANNSGRYNLPGGKTDPGESLLGALAREVFEETTLKLKLTSELQPIYAGEWRPVVSGVPLQIVGLFYACSSWEGEVSLSSEHKGYSWISKDEVGSFDILPPEDAVVKAYFSTL